MIGGVTAVALVFSLFAFFGSQQTEPIDGTNLIVRLSKTGQEISLLDSDSGEVLDNLELSSNAASSAYLLVKDFYSDGTSEVVVVTKRKKKSVQVYLVSIQTSPASLQLLDQTKITGKFIIPKNTKLKGKSIYLRNTLKGRLAVLRVKSTYTLKEKDSSLSTHVTLGDDKISTTSPHKGYIYGCTTLSGGGGSQVDGPWIHGSYWDYTEKDVAVSGSVSWDEAEVDITVQGTDRVIDSNGLPTTHPTGTFPVLSTDDAYDYDMNPNEISDQTFSLTLPATPSQASSANCIGGEVGIALNGVAIFSGVDAENRDAVAHEIQDEFGGHPQEQGVYHYHTFIDSAVDLVDQTNGMKLLGYAFDGFGIFSETEYGKTLRTDDLDACHGHTHKITWDSEEVSLYHYHVTKDYPYTVSCFRGEPSVMKL